jgi:hypothetical protein
MADKSLDDVIDRLKQEGQLTRNSGTNSLKSIKQIMIESQASGAEQKELDREKAIQDQQQQAIFMNMDDNLEKIADVLGSSSGSGSGGGLLGSLGGSGLGALLAGGGIGLGAAGAGLGAFFMGLAGAEAIMQKFGSGDNLKNLLVNLADGLAAFETRDLMAVGAVLGMGAAAGAVPGFSGTGAGMGMAAVGVGIGGFFVGLGVADATLGWLNTDFSKLKVATKGLSDALGAMDTNALTAAGGLLATGAAAGALFSARRVGKATIGMGAIGLGIGAFFAGLAAGDAAASWMNTDGTALKNMMTNVGEGLANLAKDPAALASVGALLGAGAAGGALFGPSRIGKAGIGMGAIGLGVGAFFAGLAAGDAAATWLSADGTALKNIMKNLAEGLGAFSDGQLTGLSALLGVGGIFGAVPGGLALAGGAAIGMGVIGAGLGAFMVGIASVGSVGEFVGIDGTALKNVMTNTAEGLKAFNDLDGSNLLAVAGGLAAIGPALAVYLGSEGIGSIVGGALDAAGDFYNWVFGGSEATDDPSKNKIAAIVESLKPFNDLNADNMDGFIEITDKLKEFSDAIEGITDVSGSQLRNAFSEIGSAIAYGLPIMNAMANGGRIGAAFGDGYSDTDFGRGLLDPSLRLDELALKMMQVRSILTGAGMAQALTVQPPSVEQIPSAVGVGGAELENAQNISRVITPTVGGGGTSVVDGSVNVGPTTNVTNQSAGLIQPESMNPYNPNTNGWETMSQQDYLNMANRY